jgi:surface protein
MSRNLQTEIGLLRQEVSYITKLLEGMRRDIPDRLSPYSDWDVSSVTTMASIFSNCSSATGFNLSDWNVSSVTNMSGMFSGCSSATGFNLSDWFQPLQQGDE